MTVSDTFAAIADGPTRCLDTHNISSQLLQQIPQDIMAALSISPQLIADPNIQTWLCSSQCDMKLCIDNLSHVNRHNVHRISDLLVLTKKTFRRLEEFPPKNATDKRKHQSSEQEMSVCDLWNAWTILMETADFARVSNEIVLDAQCLQTITDNFVALETLTLNVDIRVLHVLPPSLRELYFVGRHCIIAVQNDIPNLLIAEIECLDMNQRSVSHLFQQTMKFIKLKVCDPVYFRATMLSVVRSEQLTLNLYDANAHRLFYDANADVLVPVALLCNTLNLVLRSKQEQFDVGNENWCPESSANVTPETKALIPHNTELVSLIHLDSTRNSKLRLFFEDDYAGFTDGTQTMKALQPLMASIQQLSLNNTHGYEQYVLHWCEWEMSFQTLTHLELKDMVFSTIENLPRLTHLTITIPQSQPVPGSTTLWQYQLPTFCKLPVLRCITLYVKEIDDIWPEDVNTRVFDVQAPSPKKMLVPPSVTTVCVDIRSNCTTPIPWLHCLEIETLQYFAGCDTSVVMREMMFMCRNLMLRQYRFATPCPYYCPGVENLHIKFMKPKKAVAVTKQLIAQSVTGLDASVFNLTMSGNIKSIQGPLGFAQLRSMQAPWFCEIDPLLTAELTVTRF